MFGIGTSEILIILLIALLVLGPKEIPKVARTIGRTMRDLQRAKDELRETIDSEFEESEVRTDHNDTNQEENKQEKNIQQKTKS